MAIVYLAHDISLDRRVAIKVISPGLLWDDHGMAERFKREARTAAALSHPHIIPIYAVRESEDLLYFVMKFVQGRTLGSVISELGRLPSAMVQTILSQVGSALGYAHRRGVVHRDIKPGNIMLDEEGWAVVTDFGVAKVAAAEALTQTGGTLGTPTYMSPEQCSGLPVTGASDQYSLGVVAYEMVSSVKPFEGPSAMSVMYHHCHTEPTPVDQLVPGCPPALAQAIMRMLEKEPENRWPSLEDMAAAVGAISGEDSSTVRTQMLTLVHTGGARALVEKFTTPSNPSPVRPAEPPTPPVLDSSCADPDRVALAGTAASLLDSGHADPHGIAFAGTAASAVGRCSAPGAVAGAQGRPDCRAGAAGPGRPRHLAAVGTGRRGAASEGPTVAEPTPQAPASPVASSIDLLPEAPRLVVGDTVRISASVRDGTGDPLPDAPVSWTSSAPRVAEVTPEGMVLARREGQAEIRALSGDARATAVVVVEAPPTRAGTESAPPSRPTSAPVAAVAITPAAGTLTVGETMRLGAAPTDASGRALTDRSVTWSSDNRQVATVDDQGVVTAVGEGGTVIRADSEGRLGMASITVRAAAVATVEVSPARRELQPGDSVRLSAVPRDPGGAALPDRPVQWSSSRTDVARVSGAGRVTAVGPGSTTITASSGDASGSATITVSAPAAPPPAESAPAVEPTVAVQGVVEAYGRAIQDKDLAAIRRVFPDIPDDQAKGWSSFFETSTELSVTLDQVRVTVNGDGAQAVFRQRLSYRSGGPRQSLEQTVTAVLTRVGGAWLITAIR